MSENFRIYDPVSMESIAIKETVYVPDTHLVRLVIKPQWIHRSYYIISAIDALKNGNGEAVTFANRAYLHQEYLCDFDTVSIKKVEYYTSRGRSFSPFGEKNVALEATLVNSGQNIPVTAAFAVYLNTLDSDPLLTVNGLMMQEKFLTLRFRLPDMSKIQNGNLYFKMKN